MATVGLQHLPRLLGRLLRTGARTRQGPARESARAVRARTRGDARGVGRRQVRNYGAPLEKHPIDTGRLRNVIERVTAMARWSDRGGRALGLAAHRSFLTYVAVVVSIKKNSIGKIAVDEAWLAADAGTVLNLERARSQMEG